MGFELRDYQEAAIERLKRGWLKTHGTKFHKNQLIVLATGLGKTVIFSKIVDWVHKDFVDGRVLILAHREELLEQAEDKLQQTMGLADYQAYNIIQREQGKHYAKDAPIVSASVPTLGVNRGIGQWNDRMARWPRNYFKLIVIDEAHHAVASTYQHILEYFQDAWVLGVTATPKRGDNVSLKKTFSRQAYKKDIVEGMTDNWLCPVVAHRVSSTTNLRDVRTTAGDFNLKDLARAVNNTERNSLIIKTYQRMADTFQAEKQCIVFATDLDHARALRDEFKSVDIACETISGDMAKDDRKQYIADFKNKKIRVLTNYGVLTEGFDYEELDLIISARPTKSSLLLTQILGRGTRWPKHIQPHKILDFVEIVDLHSDETATAASIFGFKQDFDCEGVDFLHCIRVAKDMEKQKDYFSPWSAKSFTRMIEDFEKAKPVFGPGATNGKEWCFENRYRYTITSGNNLMLKHREKTVDPYTQVETTKNFIVRVRESSLGGFSGTISERHQDRSETKLYFFEGDTRIAVIQRLEEAIQKAYPAWDRLLNINAGWRQKAKGEPCSDKQWALIQKMKLNRGRKRESITKADAMEMLDRHFNR